MSAIVEFYVHVYRSPFPSSLRGLMVLTTDDWDDFGTRSYYHLSFVDEQGKRTDIGSVKILRAVKDSSGRRTPLSRRCLKNVFIL